LHQLSIYKQIFAFSAKNAILTTILKTYQQTLTIANSSSVGLQLRITRHDTPLTLSYSEFCNGVLFGVIAAMIHLAYSCLETARRGRGRGSKGVS